MEIEIDQPRAIGNAVPIPPAQSLHLVRDEMRTKFFSMRQIARDQLALITDHARAFYHQALFMRDFEDDYAEQESFAAYYPYYQQMSYEQLRTYFTWRTQVRNGQISDTSVSYAFLYIYELLNNIGLADPEDGFEKLLAFWQAFRVWNPAIDRYVLPWMKDYHIYYPLPHTFHDFATQHQLQMHYPTVFGYESGPHDSFDLFAGISKYHITRSIFYTEQTRPMLRDCFYFLLHRLRTLCEKQQKCFEDFVFYPLENDSTWTPFSRALFYAAFKQPDREVVISKRESYQCCEQKHWTYRTAILMDSGEALIGYLMKAMEAHLRKAVKFKHHLRADVEMCDSKTRKQFAGMKMALPELIQQTVAEFYARSTRKAVAVDTGNLTRIRAEALSIQEKLIVPEDADLPAQEAPREEPPVTVPVADIWTAFRVALTPTECAALTMILQDQDIKPLAQQHGIMLEVLVDSINQKAADAIGDTVLEIDDAVTVYDEYRERLTEMVK